MPYQIVVIGTSLGGLNALSALLGGLRKSFCAPIAIVQHRSTDPEGSLCALLQEYSPLPLSEVEDKTPVLPGRIYLAPADYHLLIEGGAFALSTDAPVWYARPSIDVLFESAADAFAERTVGVILTGASQDGANGLAKIKQRGGMAIVQAPDTAESRVMPEAAIAATDVDQILPLQRIASFLMTLDFAISR